MSKTDEAFARLMQNADDGLFDNVEATFVAKPDVEPEAVAAVFNSPVGRQVLGAMYRAFVDVSIVEPGADAITHGIRQGQANAVFWIADQIAQAHNPEGE